MRQSLLAYSLSLTLFSMLPLLAPNAFAQTAIPTTVEPGRVLPDLQPPEEAPRATAPAVELQAAPESVAPAGAEKIRFTLNQVAVTGNTKFRTSELAPLWQSRIGQQITLADVYQIASRITSLYRERGYILSRAVVPEQDVTDGTVHVQVVEGFISSYTIQGGPDVPARLQIDAYARQLVGGGATQSGTLERYLLLMNDIPGTTVRAVLSPSTSVAGGADLTLVPTRRAVEGFVSIDNYGNSYLGPTRLSGSVQYNNLFGAPDYLNVTGLWAPVADELKFISTSYRHVVGNEGTRIGGDFSYTKTNPSLPAPLNVLDTEGAAYLYRVVAEQPVVRSRSANLTGTSSFEIDHNRTSFAPGFDAIETQDDTRVLRLGATGNIIDTLGGYNTATVQGSQGFTMFGGTDRNDAHKSRANGDPRFTKLTAEATRTQRVYGPFSALVGVTGQYAFDPLLSSEEFALGGATGYGRGYDPSQITGDHGVAGKFELDYSGNGFDIDGHKLVRGYQLYGFYDVGEVWRRAPDVGVDRHGSLASAGVGTRADFAEATHGDIFVAKPLTADIPSRGPSDEDDWRIQASLAKNF